MKFPKPSFHALIDNYQVHPSSVHDCPRIYVKDTEGDTASVNTCAVRLTEALVIAGGIIESRAMIGQLTRKGGDGRTFLLGQYGYKNSLCPHGIARGARDVAYFLTEQWGHPTYTWRKPVKPPHEIQQMTGVIGFIKLPGEEVVQGHMDVWNLDKAMGHAFFGAEKVVFWKVD
jgi:hypothetical protein